MNIKKILVLLIFAIAIVGIIAPVNAALDAQYFYAESKKPINGKTKIHFAVSSDIGFKSKNWNGANYVSKRKTELNKVNKVVISIKSYKTVTFKKPSKGWKIVNANSQFFKIISVKDDSPIGKSYSVKLYDKKNKVLKSKKGKIKLLNDGENEEFG